MKCDECANFELKRAQTGWVCRECGEWLCVSLGCVGKPNLCMLSGEVGRSAWQPFYGKVVG